MATVVSAVEMGARQREISVSEFFTKNRHLLGFDNPRKALLTCVKEAVDNALDASEEAGILPDVVVTLEVVSTNGARYNCVLLTGNGQPPRGVRRLARRLHEEYKISVYVLVDNDPWGYYIYSVVKQGSINLAVESERMAIPKAKFIGLSSADPDHYGLPRNVGIKLNDKDVGRAKELLRYRWFQKKPWQDEIKRMLGAGLKYELDALANKDFRYLTKTYLPRKLKEEDWLD